MLTTVIGAYPKPSYLKITDWFNASGGTDTEYPTKFYEDEIKKMGDNVEELLSLIHISSPRDGTKSRMPSSA